jgi:hypothetical protein
VVTPAITISAGGSGTREHPGRFAYPDRAPAPARVLARHRDRAARTTRAVQALAGCWVLAVAAVFLPLLHFVLVPGLLVLGPALAWRRLHEAETLVLAEGACPACGAPQRFALGSPWRARTLLRCEACGRAIELLLPPSPVG